jgi:hypothetical protein
LDEAASVTGARALDLAKREMAELSFLSSRFKIKECQVTDIKQQPVGYVKVIVVKEHGMVELSG